MDELPGDSRSSGGIWEKLSQIAVKGAAYDSRERQPHPKCLQGTRVVLLNHINEILDKREEGRQLIWLHGTAGVGKSAVAFTVAERMRGLKVSEQTNVEKRLAGTFFFSRKHTKRCTTGYFFATLVYQLATNFPSIRTEVTRIIRENPALLDPDASLHDQMDALFIRPMRNLRIRLRDCAPLTFIVDALDECISETEAADLISLLGQALHEPDLPVIHVLLTSRSEAHISEAIQEESMHLFVCEIPVKISGEGVAEIISLDGADVDNDIYIFLEHSFTKLHGRISKFPRPTTDELARLASRAGRRFIVASTMIKFIDDGYNDPRDRLQLMLELTSELLSGTEVYKLYDRILSTCADPQRAYLHLSVVAALADPLPMSQISELLGPGQGRDVEKALVQLRSVIEIPTDSNLPVNIYHSSVRDYVSNPSNCSLPQVQHSTQLPGHSLLAYSSCRLMMDDIPKIPALLDALVELKKQSQAMQAYDPQSLTGSLAFIVQPPEPMQALMSLLWLRGYRSADLYSWLGTQDGRAWLHTQAGNDWLRTQGGRAWLRTQGGKRWVNAWVKRLMGNQDPGRESLEPHDEGTSPENLSGRQQQETHSERGFLENRPGQEWFEKDNRLQLPRTSDGRGWLRTQDGRGWLQAQEGRRWLLAHDGRRWLLAQDGRGWLRTQDGRRWLQAQDGRRWLRTQDGRGWLSTQDGREWLPTQDRRSWLSIQDGREWLPTQDRRSWLRTQDGREWLPTHDGRGWLRTYDGRDWLQTSDGRAWLQTGGGRDWLQIQDGERWLQTQDGGTWLRTQDGRDWLRTQDGRGWLRTQDGRDWLRTWDGGRWLQAQDGGDWLRTQDGRGWLQAQDGRGWLPTQDGKGWLPTQDGRDWLPTQDRRGWLSSQDRRSWLPAHDGRDWLQIGGGREWLQTQDGERWLQTQDGGNWLRTQGGRGWLPTQDGREWLRTWDGGRWLQAQDGGDWLRTQDGRGWLPTQDGRDWLRTQDGRGWLPTQDGRDWLPTQDGRRWLRTQDGRDWLPTQDGGDWLPTQDGRGWLRIPDGRDWLPTPDGRGWLQTQSGRNWLHTPDGQAWQLTPLAALWVSMEEFSSTFDAVTRYIIPELPLLPAFQVIQHFQSLPDFLMFPAFLALRQQNRSTSASPQGHSHPEMDVIHVMKAFSSFANGARERSQSSSDALKYACHNWAFHLSRVPHPWDNQLNHLFKSFWNHNLLSWLERQWCLKGLRSCLVILSEGQTLAKEHLLHAPGSSQTSVSSYHF